MALSDWTIDGLKDNLFSLGVNFISDLFSRYRQKQTGDTSYEEPSSGYVEAPSSASSIKEDNDPFGYGQYFESYLDFLQRGRDVGAFANAQDIISENDKDRAFQAEQAQLERDWYTNMSNTSYQRQMADLEAAGLNPILGWANIHSGADVASTQVPQGRASGMSYAAPNVADFMNAGAHIASSAADLIDSVSGLFGYGKYGKTGKSIVKALSKVNK